MGILFYLAILALPYIICLIMVLIMNTKLINSNFKDFTNYNYFNFGICNINKC